MYKRLLFIIALPIILFACNKSSSNTNTPTCPYVTPTTVASAAEIATLKAYLDSSSLTYTQHPSGFFYKIVKQGAGDTANVCSGVLVKYSGHLTTSTAPFDSNSTGVAFTLGQLIIGWQYGIPLIQKGGSIILYIPPSLGYGASAAGSIPPNSNLIFTIDLVDVQK